jgi:hypothetical protein
MYIINPYRFASGPPSFPWYAQGNGVGADIYDPDNIHASGVFTVPAAWDGRYVRHVGNLWENSGAVDFAGRKNGSLVHGNGGSSPEGTTGLERGFIFGAPLSVVTGDTFTMVGATAAASYQELAVLPSTYDGALAYNSSTQNITTSATTLAFDSEVYDLGNHHDNVTNNSRMTAGSGVSLVRLSACVYVPSWSVQMQLTIRMNGSNVVGVSPIIDRVGPYCSVVTPPVAVTSTDYFTVVATASSGTASAAVTGTWFCMEVLDPALKYAVGVVTSNQPVPSGSTFGNTYAMGTEFADVGSWFTAGDTFFTVPSGVTKIRMGFSAWAGATSVTSYGSMGINGTAVTDIPQIMCGYSGVNTGVEQQHGISGICTVSPGDRVYPTHASSGATNIIPDSFYWVEEVPAVTS